MYGFGLHFTKRGKVCKLKMENDRVQKVVSLLKVVLAAKKLKEDREPAEVVNGVFLGSIGAAHNKEGLKELGVTHILTVAGGFKPLHPDDFNYCLVDVADRPDENLQRYFDKCLKFIAECILSGGKVLVHCFAGKSRSATICAAYMMATEGVSLDEALEHIRGARPIINPNSGFVAQLRKFEAELETMRQSGRVLGRRQLADIAAARVPVGEEVEVGTVA